MITDELGQGGEVRHGIAGQRFKDDVGLVTPLNLATRSDAFRIGKQDDLEKYGRIVGRASARPPCVTG